MNTFPTLPTALTSGLLTALLLTGCGKKATQATTAVAAPATASGQAQSPSSPASTAAPAPPPNQYVQQSQSALRSGDYDQAAIALTTAQQQPNLNAQQAEAIAAQMRQLQKALAGAVASGDPKAKAAADRLRRSATVR